MKRVVLFLLVLFFLFGCAAKENYGHWRQDGSVQRDFQSLEYPKNYTYYYNGPFTNPIAIVGLIPGYRVESQFWHRVDLTPAQMEKWWNDTVQIDWLTTGGRNREGYANNGWRLFTSDGEAVAILFSKYKRVVASFPGPGVVRLSVPQPRASRLGWDRD